MYDGGSRAANPPNTRRERVCAWVSGLLLDELYLLLEGLCSVHFYSYFDHQVHWRSRSRPHHIDQTKEKIHQEHMKITIKVHFKETVQDTRRGILVLTIMRYAKIPDVLLVFYIPNRTLCTTNLSTLSWFYKTFLPFM